MIQNVQTLQQSAVMNYTSFAQRMMVASIFLFLIAALACLVNIFYSVALLIRLIMCFCCSANNNTDVQYIYDDSAAQQLTYTMEEPKKVYGGLWNREPRVVNQLESPYNLGRDNRTYVID